MVALYSERYIQYLVQNQCCIVTSSNQEMV